MAKLKIPITISNKKVKAELKKFLAKVKKDSEVPPKLVKALLGHKTSRAILDRYNIVNEEDLRNASELGNKLHETILKHQFMTHAVSQLWGNEDALYKEDVVFGCKLLMRDIQNDLEELESLLGKRALAIVQ